MKNVHAFIVTILAALAIPTIGRAQAAEPATPTTKILAVGTIAPGVDLAKVKTILPDEARETVKLYLAGKIDQWYSLQDQRGVVFILNLTDPDAARAMLEQLPLGQAHYMSFQLTRLGPLSPLSQLQGMRAASP